jgi:hypothetical protein
MVVVLDVRYIARRVEADPAGRRGAGDRRGAGAPRARLTLGRGKRVFPATGIDRRFTLAKATPYPTGVVGLYYTRAA